MQEGRITDARGVELDDLDPTQSLRLRVVEACHKYLRYESPKEEDDRLSGLVKTNRYDRDGGFGSKAPTDITGPFLHALRRAQFYYALLGIEDSFYQDAGFARKQYRNNSTIRQVLLKKHKDRYKAFEAEHPVEPIQLLMWQVADLMADNLGLEIL